MDTSKSFYLDLEQGLHDIILHFAMCRGDQDPEVVDGARSFQHWAGKAAQHCGPWSKEILEQAQGIFQEMEKSGSDERGHKALSKAILDAFRNLNAEIKDNLKKKA
jgi:hypothetical protein